MNLPHHEMVGAYCMSLMAIILFLLHGFILHSMGTRLKTRGGIPITLLYTYLQMPTSLNLFPLSDLLWGHTCNMVRFYMVFCTCFAVRKSRRERGGGSRDERCRALNPQAESCETKVNIAQTLTHKQLQGRLNGWIYEIQPRN